MNARVVNDFPNSVRDIEHCWIPMPDGARLAARMWMPSDADEKPVPAIVEYIPYRKRAGTRSRDEPMHRYFAGHGYAAIRIDIRGSGESDGLLEDEYTEQEHADGVAALAWIAEQPWCNGSIGMIGKSWGGFNALQIAALDPPQLKAIITVCSTDDRYRDDAHYMGGCLLNENLIWGSVLLTLNVQPPDPALVGDSWRTAWFERMEHTPLFVERWLQHQRRDAYWRHGSVCEDFSTIKCAVYAVGGWADGYTNAVPRLLAGLQSPKKGLVGPWAHVYPHEGVPGPAIGFLQEAVRWWDYWLKGIDTGIMDEPCYRVWMQEGAAPASFHETRPGRWLEEEECPPSRLASKTFFMNWRRLDERAGTIMGVDYRSPQTVGLNAGSWCGFGVQGEMPTDQREDDGKSLTFDTLPLEEPLEILGAPVVHLALTVDQPQAFVSVRLNDLHPDGASTRVTYGILNLTHRSGHEAPEPLIPGEVYECAVQLNDVAHSFAAGHRIRVVVSTTYWPLVWPSPHPVTLTLLLGRSSLELPIRPITPGESTVDPFQPPEQGPPLDEEDLHPGRTVRTVRRDITTGEAVYRTTLDEDDDGKPALTRIHPIDLETGHSVVEEFRINEHDPLSARAEIIQSTVTRRADWSVTIETRTCMRATADAFLLDVSIEAREGDTTVFTKQWERSVPRDWV